MPEMRIILDGDNSFPELQGKKIHTATIDAVTALPGGMSSGRTSVAIVIKLPDGSAVFAETSLRLFQCAAAAFTAKYGDET